MNFTNPQEAIAYFKSNVLPKLEFDNEQEKKQTIAYAKRPMGDWSPNKINQFLEKYPERVKITCSYEFSEDFEEND